MLKKFTFHTFVQTTVFIGGILLDYAVMKALGTSLLTVTLAAILGLLFGIAVSMLLGETKEKYELSQVTS